MKKNEEERKKMRFICLKTRQRVEVSASCKSKSSIVPYYMKIILTSMFVIRK